MNEIIDRAMRGEATPGELSDLAAWRRASQDNEEQYLEIVALLRALGEARPRTDLKPPRAVDVVERVRRRENDLSNKSRPSAGRWLSWGIAAAAVAALAVSLSARVGQTPPTSVWQPAEVLTGAGELATVHLGDGSVARLAPRSRLRILPSEKERLLSLEGQAFFAVAKNADRPFRVRTRDGDAVALGTRFEVATNGRGLRLIVLDGRVSLSDSTGTAQTEVGGGEAGGVVDGRLSRTSAVVNRDAVGAWMGRFLAFQSTPLPRVASEIERMYGVRVVVRDPELHAQTVSASFTDESFRQVVSVVCAVIGGRCVVTDSVVTFSR